MLHVRSVSTGVAGSPFYTNLYFNGDISARTVAVAKVRQFWVDLQAVMRTGIATSVESDVREVDAFSGEVIDIQSAGEVPIVTATGAGNVAPPATQGLIRLNTGGVRFNRRVRGRIYIPGVTVTSVTSTGSASSVYQDTLQDAAETMSVISSGVALCVWARPREVLNGPPILGAAFNVTSTSVWDQFAVLRSRRD